METKRQSQQEGVQIQLQSSKRRRQESQTDTCNIFASWRSIPRIRTSDIVPYIIPLIQRLVREQLEGKPLVRQTITETRKSGENFFYLVFENELPETLLTNTKFKAKDDKPVQIALYDIRSKSVVTEGLLSAIDIEICVLKGEFGSNGSEDWSAEEFKANIQRERENKGKLLKGDTVIKLQNGVGYITKLLFTDNSKGTRTGRFKLGAKVMQPTSVEGNIKEGTSNPFMVKERRGDLNHYPPSPDDEIWRLENISRKGEICKLLSNHGINTVKDLLHLHETDPSSLKEKFGKTSRKRQEAIIEHAKTCVPKGTLADGQNYRSQNTVNPNEKLKIVKQHDYANVKDLIPSADATPVPLTSPQYGGQCGAPNLQAHLLPTAQKDQLVKMQDFCQPSSSTSHIMDEPALNYNQVGFGELLSRMCMESLLGPDTDSAENGFSDIQFVNEISFSNMGMGPRI